MRTVLIILVGLLIGLIVRLAIASPDPRRCMWVTTLVANGEPLTNARPGSGTIWEAQNALNTEADDGMVVFTVSCIKPGQTHAIDLWKHFKSK